MFVSRSGSGQDGPLIRPGLLVPPSNILAIVVVARSNQLCLHLRRCENLNCVGPAPSYRRKIPHHPPMGCHRNIRRCRSVVLVRVDAAMPAGRAFLGANEAGNLPGCRRPHQYRLPLQCHGNDLRFDSGSLAHRAGVEPADDAQDQDRLGGHSELGMRVCYPLACPVRSSWLGSLTNHVFPGRVPL